jgi:hypothetical protein
LKSPPVLSVNEPSTLTWFAPPRLAPPVAFPVKIPAVMTPVDCEIVPEAVRVTVLPVPAVRSLPRDMVEPTPPVVVSVRFPADLIVPPVVSACASVKLKLPLPVLANGPRAST